MAKKKRTEEEIRRGLDELRHAGLAVDEPSPDLIPQLSARAGSSRAAELAGIYLLGKIVDAKSVAALEEIAKATTDKEIKKEIKRAFFKLAQKGLVSSRQDELDKRTTTYAFQRAPEIEAYMSSVDDEGGRLVWIARAHPRGGLQVIQAMVNDQEGLLRVGGAKLRRQELRDMAEEIKKKHEIEMISVPWEYADQILYQAHEKGKTLGRSGLERFHELRALVNADKPKAQQHPIYGKINPGGVRTGAWREQSRRLLDERELRYWILKDEWLQPFLPQLEEAQTSRLVLNAAQKEERIAAIVREAAKALYSGEFGRMFQRRMEDMALYFFETRRPELAKLALAVALQVGEGDPGPLDVSFLTGLVQKSFAYFLSQQKAKAEEERSSLIIKP